MSTITPTTSLAMTDKRSFSVKLLGKVNDLKANFHRNHTKYPLPLKLGNSIIIHRASKRLQIVQTKQRYEVV